MCKRQIFIFCFVTFVTLFSLLIAQGDNPLIWIGGTEVITTDNVNEIIALISPDDAIKQISFSPDNMMLAIARQVQDADYDITIYDAGTGDEIGFLQGRMDFFQAMTWSPDSTRIAVISRRITGGGIELRGVKTYMIELSFDPSYYILGNSDTWYTDEVSITEDLINPVDMAWNSVSSMIAIAFYNSLQIYDVRADALVYSEDITDIETVDWTENGQFIIVQAGNNNVSLWGVP